MRSQFQIFLFVLAASFLPQAAFAEQERAGRQTVYLTVREPEGYNPSVGFAAPLLERELIRQALLLAARDELGLATRDVLLREEFPEKPDEQSPILELYCQASRVKKDFDVEYRLGLGPQKQLIWRWVYNTDINNPRSLTTLTEIAESLARHQLKDALTRSGFGGTVPPARETVPVLETVTVPGTTYDLLWSWNEISVIAGLRRIHAESREKGESPELLAALAIGYINLGTITEYYYSAGFKAYDARALLYAERLVRKTHESPWALWHRGYVRLQLGLHNFGAEDLAEARKKQGAAAPARPLPFWADIAEAFGQGELSRMVKIAKTPEQRRLARELDFQAVRNGNVPEVRIKAAQKFLKECHDCPWVGNELALSGGLGPAGQSAYVAFGTTSEFLRKRLPEVPGLPADLAQRIRSTEEADDPSEIEFRKGVIATLKRAGAPQLDRGEPSLSAVGHAIEEIDFAQLMRRLEFESNSMAVSTKETIATFGPLCAAHPYAAYIDAYASDDHARADAAAALLKKIELYACTSKEHPVLQWLYGVTPTQALHDWFQAPSLHSDMVFSDEAMGIALGWAGPADDRKYNRPYMMKVWNTSNKLPASVALRISRDWAHARQETDVRERDYVDDPLVMTALTERYFNLQRYDDAERCAKHLADANPGYPSYGWLSAIYKIKKDFVHWKETLDKAIALPSPGLERASFQNEIAKELLERKRWQEAVVYADSAANSYSEWSLLTDARCHEMLGDWKKAEQLVRAASERYNDGMLSWMFWCHRTGHGDKHAADEFARQQIESWGTNLRGQQYRDIAIYYLLTNEPDKALVLWKRSYEVREDPFAGLHSALVADTLGKTAERDALLKRVIDTKLPENYLEFKTSQYYQQLAAQFQAMLPPKAAKQLNLPEIEKIQTAAMSDKLRPSTLLYFVGVFLKNRGDLDTAKKYLIRCAQSNDWDVRNHVLACQLLQELKVTVPPTP
jgi:tetratricopeptide (TPR) repeat protein